MIWSSFSCPHCRCVWCVFGAWHARHPPENIGIGAIFFVESWCIDSGAQEGTAGSSSSQRRRDRRMDYQVMPVAGICVDGHNSASQAQGKCYRNVDIVHNHGAIAPNSLGILGVDFDPSRHGHVDLVVKCLHLRRGASVSLLYITKRATKLRRCLRFFLRQRVLFGGWPSCSRVDSSTRRLRTTGRWL